MADNKKIIVVEDDSDFLESIVEYLTLCGFDVTGVKSALEFYYSISQNNYLLVVLDIGLPDQNGLVLADYVRNNTDIRIIILTAQSSLETKITAYKAGADIYLVKPIDLSELAASIQSIVGRLENSAPSTHYEPLIKEEEAGQENNHTSSWKLSRRDWVLYTPENNTVKLTSKEFYLLEMLASSPNKIVQRQNLLETLDYGTDDSGNRALDALVYRLRLKKGDRNEKLPIKTAHGTGYYFSAPIVIE